MKHTIFVSPLITEKSMQQAAKRWFTFKAPGGAAKPHIAHAIETQFNVHVKLIKTAVIKGKTQHTGRRRTVHKVSNWKKAFVKLANNETIPAFNVESAPVTEKPVKKQK